MDAMDSGRNQRDAHAPIQLFREIYIAVVKQDHRQEQSLINQQLPKRNPQQRNDSQP